METSLREFIGNYLVKSEPRFPVPTEMNPMLNPIPDIKAVFFDIYGTLLISSSGDVDIIKLAEQNVLKALRQSGIRLLHQDNIKTTTGGSTAGQESCRGSGFGTLLRTIFVETIKSIHKEKKKTGIPYPEVNIIDVWKKVLLSERLKGLIELPGSFDYKSFALVFEMLNNPVYPMPGMKSVLFPLYEKNILLGIVSNAQFYTPVLLNYFIAGTLSDREEIHLFQKECLFFSYQFLRAKPDPFLFNKAKEMLLTYQIKPENVLYIGNDMRNDIIPAGGVGFKTVLFAGDKRSLRLRESDAGIRGTEPDAVITELPQLLSLIGLVNCKKETYQ